MNRHESACPSFARRHGKCPVYSKLLLHEWLVIQALDCSIGFGLGGELDQSVALCTKIVRNNAREMKSQ
jgi:hypothetical protein